MSHFTKIKTKLYNLDILKKSLSDLNIEWTDKVLELKGFKGQNHKAELIIPQENNYDIGFKWNGQEYELITDLMFWSQQYSIDKFINRINQRYAYNLILEVSEKKGFNFAKTEVNQDGSVRLLLQRFN